MILVRPSCQAAAARAAAPSSRFAASSQKLDVTSVESRTYLGQLARKRGDFENNARRAVPSAQITHRLDVFVNAVALTVPEGDVGMYLLRYAFATGLMQFGLMICPVTHGAPD